MSQDQAQENPTGSELDDTYWGSLFQLEESFMADMALPDDLPEEQPAIKEIVAGPPTVVTPAAPVPQGVDGWQLAHAYFEADKTVQLKVTGYNKGGLLVFWNGIQGFVPASQLIDLPQFHLPRERLRALETWQDRELSLKIIEINQEKNRLIFSERAALVQAVERESLLHGVLPGERRTGKVTNLTEFGAFVDLGGVEGLIHISEISWSRVAHPSQILQPDQEVEVLVLSVDPGSERVALSTKRLRPDPWLTAEARYRPDQLVQGTVSNITTYGAFVVLEEELEGLVHISELAEGMFLHPRDVVQIGEMVIARVLTVDSSNKRIALTMRGLGSGTGAQQ